MNMDLHRVTLEGYRSAAEMMFNQEETLESIVARRLPGHCLIVSHCQIFLKDKELGRDAPSSMNGQR